MDRRMSKSFNIPLQTLLIFLLLLAIGSWLAAKKPLWNDEAYSQVNSIQRLSYTHILIGRVPEGNVCPLFYLIQKLIGNAANYALPVPWDGKPIVDTRAQWIFRIAPDLCMSLAMALIFYFFARFYSWWWGFYALMMSLSSFMVWAYWVEARPYALWFLLTTAQLLALIKLLANPDRRALWSSLTICHFLLGLTVIFAIVQIAIVSFLLWIFKQKDRKKYILASWLPMAIGLYYYSQAPKYTFWLDKPLWGLIDLNLPSDILWIAGIYALFCAVYRRKSIRRPTDGWVCLLLMAMMAGAALALIAGMTRGHHPREGFELTFRYFIFLTPLGIIAATVFAKDLTAAFQKDWWAVAMTVIVLGGLLIIRCLKAYMLILGWYAFP